MRSIIRLIVESQGLPQSAKILPNNHTNDENALYNARALENLSSGEIASACSTHESIFGGKSGHNFSRLGRGADVTSVNTSLKSSAINGGLPVSARKMMAPREYTSMR